MVTQDPLLPKSETVVVHQDDYKTLSKHLCNSKPQKYNKIIMYSLSKANAPCRSQQVTPTILF